MGIGDPPKSKPGKPPTIRDQATIALSIGQDIAKLNGRLDELTKELETTDEAIAETFEGICQSLQSLDQAIEVLANEGIAKLANRIIQLFVSNLILLALIITLFMVK